LPKWPRLTCTQQKFWEGPSASEPTIPANQFSSSCKRRENANPKKSLTSITLIATILVTGLSFFILPGHAIATDWSIEPSQTLVCYHALWVSAGIVSSLCQAIRAEIKIDTQETNSQVDYYQVVLRVYNYNSSALSVIDYSTWVSYNYPNPGGIDTVQPQSGYVTFGQANVALTYSFLNVGLYIPYQQIDFTATIAPTETLNWHVHSFSGTAVYGFYAEQGFDVSIPEGQGWTFNFRYRDNTAHFQYSGCQEGTNPDKNNCYFDITGSIAVDPGHVDPQVSGGGGGCFRCWRN